MAPEPSPTGYLFLDVDGVLNPESNRLAGFDDWVLQRIGDWPVWTSPALGAWLCGLVEAGVQIVWATTWIHEPDRLAELAETFGLPTDLSCIDELEWPDGSSVWDHCGKGPGVLRWLIDREVDTTVTPVVWVDDCLSPGDHDLATAAGIVPIRVRAATGLDDPEPRRLIETSLTQQRSRTR